MSAWPFPGEPPVVRARRVAQAYRAALEHHAPQAAAHLDARIVGWGERWAVPQPATWGPDDWLTAEEAGELLCTSAKSVHNLRRRGRLTGRRSPATGRWEYRARDVAQLSAEPRRRRRRASDTLDENGRSVS